MLIKIHLCQCLSSEADFTHLFISKGAYESVAG